MKWIALHMDKNQLEDLAFQEKEIFYKMLFKAFELPVEARNRVSIADFFPEFKLNQPHTNLVASSTWVQLPFYEQVIFPLNPYKSEQLFKDNYGISVEELIELIKLGKILLVRHSPLSEYEGLDYLDPVLERKPPGWGSRRAVYEIALFGIETVGTMLEPIYMGRSSVREKRLTKIRQACKKLKLDLYPSGPNAWEVVFEAYCNLYCNGYKKLAEKIISLKDATLASFLVKALEYVLIDAPLHSLDGITCLTNEDIGISKLAYALNNRQRFARFPPDIGRLLIKEMKLVDIANVGLDRVISICKETRKSRKALEELDRVVSNAEVDKVVDRAAALQTVWQDANETISSFIERKHKYQLSISVSLGVGGALAGGVAGLPGLLAGALFGILTSVPLAESSAEYAARLRMPNHVIALYELKKSLHKQER